MYTEDTLKSKTVKDYWKKKLSGETEGTSVAHLERSVLNKPAFSGTEQVTGNLPAEAEARISAMCNASPILIFNFHLSVLGVLFQRYLHAESFTAGSSRLKVPGEQDAEGLLFFSTAVSPSRSFKELFGQMKSEVLETVNHEDIDYDTLSGLHSSTRMDEMLRLGLHVQGANCETELLKSFALLVSIEGNRITATFRAGELDRALLENFLGNYTVLLASILEDPYTPLHGLEFISDREKQLLLSEFQGKARELEYPTVVERFEAQVLKTPHKPALEINGNVLSYRELDEASNRLAHHLLSLADLRKDDRVALVMDRTEKMAQSVWAVWKAGAAYVPVDPAYPEDRIRAILESSCCRLIITEEKVSPGLRELLSSFCPVVSADGERDRIQACPAVSPGIKADPSGLAYVIYTSGSTGRPKGVMIEHSGMMNHIEAKISEMEIDENSVVVQNAPQCFDISVWQMFSAMMTGGKTVIYDNEVVLNIEEFIRRVDSDGVTTLELVPSYLFEMQYILEELNDPLLFSKLNILILNAETLLPALVQRWFSCYPHIRIVNTYGATEVSDDMSHYIMDRLPDTATIPVMYRPIQNFHLYILDENRQLCPAGVKGEIYLSGFAVGRGYLNDPEKTAASFLTDHLRAEPGVRMYKTGDIGRLLPDGRMEFYGRRDYQVKIRGHRVELGEIEHVLTSLDLVKNAVVVDLEAEDSQKYLAAYVIAEAPLDNSVLVSRLKEHLPEYMIPAYFIRLESFPLTPNGKVDKKALPAPRQQEDISAEYDSATPDDTALAMLRIWKEVLNRENVRFSDNFFETGGHSLLATKLVYRIHRELQVKLDLRTIFTHPTLTALTGIVREQEHNAFTEIRPLPEQDHYQLSHAQKRLWILCQMENNSVTYNMHGAYRFSGSPDVQAFRRSFGALISRHESLRTVFITVNGEPRQKVIAPEASGFRLELVDVSAFPDPEAEAVRLSNAEALLPFDLEAGPLLRSTLIRLAEDSSVFLLTMHHIISDGWSMGVLVNEVADLYNQLLGNTPSPLSPLRIQYRDYAAWQNMQLHGDSLKKHQEYWLREFSGEIPVLQMPYDRPRPKVQTFHGELYNFTIGSDTVERLKAFSRSQDVTLFVSLLAASNALLYRYTGQTDIIVGSPVAGREHADLEQQIGFYVNTLAFRTRFSHESSFLDLLKATREQTINAYEHQLYPFDRLVDDLRLKRDLSRSALFDVMIALQNTEQEANKIPSMKGIHIEGFTSERKVSMFDLTISFTEGNGVISASVEYNTDLFNRSTMVRLGRHFTDLLSSLLDSPEQPVGTLGFLSGEEMEALMKPNLTQRAYPQEKTLCSLFEEQAIRTPDAVAVLTAGRSVTYAELNSQANRLAALLTRMGAGKGSYIGIILDRDIEMIAAVMAVMKSGAAYVPFEPGFPRERIENIIGSLGICCVLTQQSCRRWVEDMQYSLESLRDVVYLDVDTPELPPAEYDRKATEGLWDYIAEKATDTVTAGGFRSAYTGELFSEEEVQEYADRVTGLAAPFLSQDSVVVEIGNGSGLLMFSLCSRVKKYIGIDPSPLTQQKNLRTLEERNIQNTELHTGYADELLSTVREPVDLVIIASTVQFFPDYTYLSGVLSQCFSILKPGGRVVIADVPDPEQKAAFRSSLDEHLRNNPQHKGKVKQNIDEELYVSRQWWEDAASGLPVKELHFSWRTGGFANELKYRYDIVLTKGGEEEVQIRTRQKRHWTLFHAGNESPDNPIGKPEAGDIAYVIYTSGSTGVPKGVSMKHRPLVNLIDWVNRTYRINAYDRLLFVTSLCFDLSVYDIFGMLASGGSIRIASAPELKDPETLYNLLCHEGITFWDSAPATMQQLSLFMEQKPRLAASSSLRLVFLSGDWIPVSLPGKLKAAFPGVRVIALGGATEAAVWSNYFEVDEVDPYWVSIPYGAPIQNACYYVLNESMQVQPTGVPGDLYIGGECLAEGYVNDAKLTADRFLSSPFGPGRIYRTGDMARWKEDGIMEFLGRKDQQVKIRGYRIELGEIENQLRRHPLIDNALVTDVIDKAGNRQLAAYYESAHTLDMPVLSEFLQRTLPDYMIPSYFTRLEHIPLSNSGKVDKKALPSPQESLSRQEAYEPPHTETEERIARIWQEILGLKNISTRSNFFEVGGNSLKLVELYRLIDREFPATVSVTNLFDNTSISRQAAFITARLDAKPVQAVAEEFREIEL